MAAKKHNKMMGLNLVLVFALTIVQLSEGNYLSTPVMIWRNSRRFGADNVLAGHSFNASDVFEKYVQPELKELNIVLVFVQDELSIDDFMKYPESFNYLKYAIENFSPLLLPSVSQEKQSVDKLIRNYAGQNLEEVFSSDLSDWKFDLQSKTLVYIFHLEPVNGAESKKEVFSQNNQEMKKIISAVDEAKKQYSVIFTSQHPSQFVSNVLNMEQSSGSSLSSRHLLSQDSGNGSVQTIPTGTLFNNTCVYLFASSIKFGPPNNLTDFINSTWSVKGSCLPQYRNYSIILETVNRTENFKMEIKMGFENQSLYWTCLSVTVDATFNGTSNTTVFPCDFTSFSSDSYFPVRAPIQFSYTCTDIKFISSSFMLTIGDLQLEPGMSSIHFFSTDYSCTGFFTLEILTGLMTIFVMIIGLIVGIGMISAIQTQDRFDDPKGKSISVPLTE